MYQLGEVFQEYIGKKVALYGLGTETQRVLPSLEGSFEIDGLLDSYQKEGELYGKKIISLEKAAEDGVVLVIVVARPGSCKAISKRIGDFCRKHGIALMDIRGKDLLERTKIAYSFANVRGGTKAELYKRIEQAEVVSFDLFDTLIMREVLSPTDILELVDEQLRVRGICIHNFTFLRIEAEKRLSRDYAPALEEVYEDILKQVDIIGISAAELAQLEWNIDYKTILPRKAVCEIYEHCIQKGKRVSIVTDSYYNAEQIKEILKKCHLTGYNSLFVSSQYGTGKQQKLFDKMIEAEGKYKYLHIGDDLVADMEAAAKIRIDTFHILSGEELLGLLGGMGMEEYMDSFAARLKVGMFVARLFNDPFQFEVEQKELKLWEAFDIGYLICAPVIVDFVFWLQERIQYYDIRNIWFCARDGYLLKRMYKMLDDDTDAVYFQTSRIVAVRAGMSNEEDISYVDSMKFNGTLEENLEARFGIQLDEAGVLVSKAPGLMGYKKLILNNAVLERRRYGRYISTLQVREGTIAFFDFVAKGTTQMYVQRIVGNHLKGFYFLQLEPDLMRDKGLDIEPFYKTEETDASTVYENYYVLETVLTAPHPSVAGFDDMGKVIYSRETRKEREIRCSGRVQEGILNYFARYLELLPINMRDVNKKLDEVMLGLINRLKIMDEDFLSLVVEDSFFNRMTDMKDLICLE